MKRAAKTDGNKEGVTVRRRAIILGALAAPAVVRAESLMPLWVSPLVLYGDGIHDDTEALQTYLNGGLVRLTDRYRVMTAPVIGSALVSGEIVTYEHTKQEWRILDGGKFMFRRGDVVMGEYTGFRNCELTTTDYRNRDENWYHRVINNGSDWT